MAQIGGVNGPTRRKKSQLSRGQPVGSANGLLKGLSLRVRVLSPPVAERQKAGGWRQNAAPLLASSGPTSLTRPVSRQ
jgi:hypothetical protein